MTIKRLHIFRYFFLFLLIQGQQYIYGQTLSNKGRFEVNFAFACAPFTVSITELDGLGNVSRQYDYENDSIFVNNTSHTYNTPGTYQIVQLINVDTLTDKLDTIFVTVLDSPEPVFSAFNCKNNTVSIDVINESYYDSLEIDYGDGTLVRVRAGTLVPDHTYPGVAPQTFNISVKGLINNALDNCASLNQSITTIGNLIPPDLSSVLVTVSSDTGSIDLGFNLGPNVNYEARIGVNGTSTTRFENLLNTSTRTVDALNTLSNYYCFQLAAVDVCDGQTIFSETVCTLSLNTTAENDQNRLDWNTSAPAGTTYTIFKDGVMIHSANDINTYTDTDVVCQISYCYQVEVAYASTAIANSNESCVVAISTSNPPALPNITASVIENSIELSWDSPSPPIVVQQYQIFKSSNGSFFAPIATVTTNSFTDTNLRIDQSQYCYRVDYLDECANSSLEGSQACAILLSANEDASIVTEFSWSDYEGWINGIQDYILEKLDQNGTVVSSQSAGLQTSFTDMMVDPEAQFVAFRIRAIGTDGFEAVSNVLEFQYEAKLFIPDAFSPNNDGVNDILEINSIFVDRFSIKYFNRWGEEVYSSEDLTQAWDGLLGNNEAPEGTYAYIAEITDFNGTTKKQAGSFILLRY